MLGGNLRPSAGISEQDIPRAALLLHDVEQPIKITAMGDRSCHRARIRA